MNDRAHSSRPSGPESRVLQHPFVLSPGVDPRAQPKSDHPKLQVGLPRPTGRRSFAFAHLCLQHRCRQDKRGSRRCLDWIKGS
jgi:hypothetical protein